MFKKNIKLRLFAFNESSGSTITNYKKKRKANTDEIIKLDKDVDEYGLDFFLPGANGVTGVEDQDSTKYL